MKSNRRAGAAVACAATAALLATGLATPGAATAATTGGKAASRQAFAPDHARTALSHHLTAFRSSAHDSFSQRGAAVVDKDGATHVRYDRTYRGLPVLGGDVVVHLTKGGTYDGGS